MLDATEPYQRTLTASKRVLTAPELIAITAVTVVREPGETDERYARRCALQALVSQAQEVGEYE